MKILVIVKEVAEVEEDFELDGLRVADQCLNCDLNERDEHVVEKVVRIAEESDDDVGVVAVTIGLERPEETIRMVFTKGADHMVHVQDDALDGADLLDAAAKTCPLSTVIEDEDPDLVLTSVQTNDNSFGVTSVSPASIVGFEWAAVMNALNLGAGDGATNVRYEFEGGVEELTGVNLPVVLTVQTGINESRYANLRGIRQVQSKEIRPLALSDLGLDTTAVESDLILTDVYEPGTEPDATCLEDDAGEQAVGLATVLQEKGVGAQ